MRAFLAILAGAALATAATAQTQSDLVARIHFLGGDRISAAASHLAFANEFSSAPAQALEKQTLDKLSRAPGVWFKSKMSPGAGDGAAQLRPLLDDLLKSEWAFEVRAAPNGPPEYAFAIRLGNDRAALWSRNLAGVLQNWTGMGIAQDRPGIWELKKHEPPNLIRFSRSGDFVVIDCGQNQLQLGDEILQPLVPARPMPLETNWLAADLDWPRLARIFPALQEFDFPKIQMQVAALGTNLQVKGKLTLARPLPPLEPWRVPTNVIHQPFISFTSARGVGPWLARQSWMQPLTVQPQPDQVFVWAMARMPFQTFAAEPVPDANAALAQLGRHLLADTAWQNHLMNPLAVSITNHQISCGALLFITPFIKPVHEAAGDFLFGGFFPNTLRPTPLPPELFTRLAQPGLVYYHWENTTERLRELPQFSQLLLMLTLHRQVDMQSAAGKWLKQLEPSLGTTRTEAFQIAPNEVIFTRQAPAGLTALELLALVDWLEAPDFPAPDLRLPMRSRPRRPLPAFPGMPVPAPAPVLKPQ